MTCPEDIYWHQREPRWRGEGPADSPSDLREDAVYCACALRRKIGVALIRVVDHKRKTLFKGSTTPNKVSINYAELRAVLAAIGLAHDLGKKYVFTSSSVVFNWVMGQDPRTLCRDRDEIHRDIGLARSRTLELNIEVRLWIDKRNGGRKIPGDYGRRNCWRKFETPREREKDVQL